MNEECLSTLAYDFVDDTMLVVHAPCKPREDEFRQVLAAAGRIGAELRTAIVLAGSHALTGPQRKRLSDVLLGSRIEVAVLTETGRVRMAAAHLRALGHRFRTFGAGELDLSMEELGLRTDTRARLRTTVADLSAALQLPTALGDEADRECRDSADALRGVGSFSEACGFSAREREAVLALVCVGSRAEVAEHMSVSEGTVHTYLSRACVKAGVRTEMDLLRAIIRHLHKPSFRIPVR